MQFAMRATPTYPSIASRQCVHRKELPRLSLQNPGGLAKKSADIPWKYLGYLSSDD